MPRVLRPTPPPSLLAAPFGVVTTAVALAAGLTHSELRALVHQGTWHRLARGQYYVGAAAPDLPARVQGGLLSTGARAACLATALALHGRPEAADGDELHLLAGPATRHQRQGLRLHWFTCPDADLTVRRGLPVTSMARSLSDVAGRDAGGALAVLDALARRRQLPDRARLATMLRGERALRLLSLVDGRSESALESRSRLLFHDAGAAPSTLQLRLMLPSYGLARVDLGYEQERVGVECDGRSVHDLPEAIYRDRLRQSALEDLGWRIVRVTWRDVLHDPTTTVHRLLRALGRQR